MKRTGISLDLDLPGRTGGGRMHRRADRADPDQPAHQFHRCGVDTRTSGGSASSLVPHGRPRRDHRHGQRPGDRCGHVAEKIMTPFFTTKKDRRAPGLGLSLSRAIARRHGGDLAAGARRRATPGSSSNCHCVPASCEMRREEAEVSAVQPHEDAAGRGQPGSCARSWVELLSLDGHQVKVFLDGRALLAEARAIHWCDALITDYYLPDHQRRGTGGGARCASGCRSSCSPACATSSVIGMVRRCRTPYSCPAGRRG